MDKKNLRNQQNQKTTVQQPAVAERVVKQESQQNPKFVEVGRLGESDENSDDEYEGQITLDEGDHWLYGFMKKDDKGNSYMSLTAIKKKTPPDEQNLDRGVLFRNGRSKLRKTDAHYTGNIAVSKPGTYDLVANILESKSNQSYMEIGVITGNDDSISEDDLPF